MKRFDVQVFRCDFFDQSRKREPRDQVVGRLLVTPNLLQGQCARSISVRLSRRLRRCRRLLNSTGRRFRKLSARNFRSEFWHRFASGRLSRGRSRRRGSGCSSFSGRRSNRGRLPSYGRRDRGRSVDGRVVGQEPGRSGCGRVRGRRVRVRLARIFGRSSRSFLCCLTFLRSRLFAPAGTLCLGSTSHFRWWKNSSKLFSKK